MVMNSSTPRPSARRRGRPRGLSNARERILTAAREAFTELGYRRATLRRIAGIANVDVALLNYHFGSKHGLFAAALAARVDPAERLAHALTAPPSTLPDVLAVTILDAYDEPANVEALRHVLSASLERPGDASGVTEYLDGELAARIRHHLAGPGAAERAAAAIALIAGTIMTRFVLELPTATDAAREAFERRLAAMLRVALAPEPRTRARRVTAT